MASFVASGAKLKSRVTPKKFFRPPKNFNGKPLNGLYLCHFALSVDRKSGRIGRESLISLGTESFLSGPNLVTVQSR